MGELFTRAEEVRTMVHLINKSIKQVKQDYAEGLINGKQFNAKIICYMDTLDALKWVLGERDYQNN